MSSSRNVIDWDQLKPRILNDLANGKTQQQIRQGLAKDPSKVSISKSQLETQLKRWNYRRSLHEPEWKVVSHRINKRRKAGKTTSQVVVNGFIFSERQVSKAINRYDTPTLAYQLPSPKIPPDLRHHLIEVRTPPPSHPSPQPQPSEGTVDRFAQGGFDLHLKSVARIWPRNTQWETVESSVGQFVARFFIPTYEQDVQFRDAFKDFRREPSVSQNYRGRSISTTHENCENVLVYRFWDNSPNIHCDASFRQSEVQRSFAASDIHTVLVQTLVGLLYQLSNQCLAETGRKTLVLIMEAPAWDAVLPHLRETLAFIDPKLVQAIAEGLLKESIRTCHEGMLDLSLGLGADPTQRMKHYSFREKGFLLSTPLVALCSAYSQKGPYHNVWNPSPERLILSLMGRDEHVSNSTLLWIIRAGFHAIAENAFRSEPERAVDFSIAASDLEGGSWLSFDTYDPVTPLLVVCSDVKSSAEKLSLIRYLLERNAIADLEAMIAAAGTCDGEVVSLLHQHGAPVNGFIHNLGSPLLSACKAALRNHREYCADLTAIPLLLRLGAFPYHLEDGDLSSWELSPLHILARAEEEPLVTEALGLLIESGANINHHARLCRVEYFRCMLADIWISPYGRRAQTALECAIESSRWSTATQLLSADCELTGREILFIHSTLQLQSELAKEVGAKRFNDFVGALLEKDPSQADARHWSGLTVLQKAVEHKHEDMIQALFEFGVEPSPSDFTYMLCNDWYREVQACQLSSSIQMRLIFAAKLSETSTTDISTVRLILGYACPEVVRHVFTRCPDVYDSEGLCFLIARIVSNEFVYDGADRRHQQTGSLTMDDLHEFIRRRPIYQRRNEWEGTAVAIAARAGRTDILQTIIASHQNDVQSDGIIPSFLLKEALISDRDMSDLPYHWERLGIWIKYCRMDDPNTRCSPLTAAVMAEKVTAAEEVVDVLLALGYKPDAWTILVASCKGRLSILQRLKQLDCWSNILSHTDRPDWCPTALQTAVYGTHVSTVMFLLDAETTIDTIDMSPCRPFCFAPPEELNASNSHTVLPKTALQHAVEKENMELVTILVRAGADVNAPASMDSGATALQIASIRGSVLMMQYLLDQGADPYAGPAAKHGRTALQGAVEHGRKDALELLLAHGGSTTYWRREQLVEAIFYAENNAQYVVSGILRGMLVPQWSWGDEETLKMLSENWDHSSEHSAFHELRHEFEAFEEMFETWPEASTASHEGDTDSDMSCEDFHTENTMPKSAEDNESWSLQETEFGVHGHGGLDFHQIGEMDLYDGDAVSELTFQEDATAWVQSQWMYEAYRASDVVFGDFLFDNF